MNDYKDDEYEIDLFELFQYLWKHALVLAAALIIAAGIGFAVSKFILTPMYDSTSMIYITGSSGGSVSSMLSELQAGNALTADYQTLATSRPVVEKVIDDLKLDTDYDKLSERISTENPANTRILSITVTDEDPDMAKTIVDDLTDVMIEQVADVMNADRPNIVQKGDVAEEPSKPSVKKNTLIAGLLGLLIVVVILVFNFIMNDTIKTPEDVEHYLGLNNLGSIPLAKGVRKNTRRSGKLKARNRRKY